MEEYTRKERGRSKIFRSCFSSSTTDERPFSCDKSDRRNTINGRLRKAVLMAVSGRKRKDPIPNNNFVSGNGSGATNYYYYYSKRCTHGQLISRLLKSVWFDSLMVKKIHTSSSKSLIGSTKNESFLSIKNTCKSSNLLSSSSQTTCCSSYCTSSSSDQQTSSSTNAVDFRHQISVHSKLPDHITSSSRSYLEQTYPHLSVSSNLIPIGKLNSRKTKSCGNNFNIRLCLFFLLSLVVLIFYGRFFSILCTSALFYFLPSRQIKRVNSVSSEHQYKKRVVMACLLDRARNPLRFGRLG